MSGRARSTTTRSHATTRRVRTSRRGRARCASIRSSGRFATRACEAIGCANLRVVSRNASGRVARLQAEGFTPSEITGHDFRMALGRVAGWQRIKSTDFEVRRTGNGFQLRGRGMGHGVGLCVIGAGKRATAGRSADEILRFYFPTLQVGLIPETTITARGTPTVAQPARPAADRADVRVALPANEETERPRIVELVRRARDQIAAATGVTAPAAITRHGAHERRGVRSRHGTAVVDVSRDRGHVRSSCCR